MFTRSYKFVDKRRFEVFMEEVCPRRGDVVLQLEYSAICKADLRYYLGSRSKEAIGAKYPINLIHEATATVLKDFTGNLEKGDKVVLIPNFVREKCSDCRCDSYELMENYCPNALFASSNCDGFSKEVFSYPARNVLKLERESYGRHYVFLELISVAIAATRKCGEERINKDTRVLVFGDGILGYIMCAVIKEMFGSIVYCCGKHTKKLGMFEMCDEVFLSDNLPKADLHFDCIFECVGGTGAESAINAAIDLLGVGGRIVLTGVSEEPVKVNTRRLLEKGIELSASTRSCVADFEKAIKLMKGGTMSGMIKALILEEIEIKDIEHIYLSFEQAVAEKRLGKAILNWS